MVIKPCKPPSASIYRINDCRICSTTSQRVCCLYLPKWFARSLYSNKHSEHSKIRHQHFLGINILLASLLLRPQSPHPSPGWWRPPTTSGEEYQLREFNMCSTCKLLYLANTYINFVPGSNRRRPYRTYRHRTGWCYGRLGGRWCIALLGSYLHWPHLPPPAFKPCRAGSTHRRFMPVRSPCDATLLAPYVLHSSCTFPTSKQYLHKILLALGNKFKQ